MLLDNLFGHKVSKVGSCLRITPLELLPPNTTNRFQPMDVDIIAFFKAQYRKLVIQYQIDCFSANKVFAIDIYHVVVMVKRAWRAGIPHRQFKIVGGIRVLFRSLLRGRERKVGAW